MRKRIASLAIAAVAAIALSLPVQAKPIVDPTPPKRLVTALEKTPPRPILRQRLRPPGRAEYQDFRKKARGPEIVQKPRPVHWVTSQAYA